MNSRNEIIARRYAEGETSTVLAQDFGVSIFKILKIVRAAAGGVRPRGRPMRNMEPDRNENLVERYLAGESYSILARRFGIGWKRVNKIVRAAVVPIRPPGRKHPGDADRDAEIVRRYAAGESSKVIGKMLGMGAATVLNLALAAGVPIRGCGRKQRGDSDRNSKLIEEYLAGETHGALSARFGIGMRWVSQIIKKSGVHRPGIYRSRGPETLATVFHKLRDANVVWPADADDLMAAERDPVP